MMTLLPTSKTEKEEEEKTLAPTMRRPCLLLACAALCAASVPTQRLTDSTFEHTTQAATGQTTGKW